MVKEYKNTSGVWFALLAVFISVGVVFLVTSLNSDDDDADDSTEAVSTQPSSTPQPPQTDEIRSIQDIDFASYSRDLAKFVGLEIGQSLSEANGKVENYFTPGQGIPEGELNRARERASSETSFSTISTDGGTVIVAERNNMVDDSVQAQRLYLLTKRQTDGTETLVDYGMKIKCWRGTNKNTWQTELCP